MLAVGSGPFFVSLVSALIESGLPKFHVLITDSLPTNRQRLMELVAHARKADSEVEVEEARLQEEGVGAWREIVQPFDSILYVSQEGEVEELRVLHSVCREEKKMLLPSICLQHVGLAGPLVHPDSKACWESAWRRMHQSELSKDRQFPAFSYIAGAMLANVIVFELFKEITRVNESERKNQFFLLDLDTLEGNWHSFMPHPLVTGNMSVEWVKDLDIRMEQSLSKAEPSGLLLYFNKLTSAESGIFHIWEEGDLIQLPLSQCRVQAVDPLSEGPAELLPEILSTGLTHEEARREAGLSGIEAYVSRLADQLVTTLPSYQEVLKPQQYIGVGAGETVAESVCRGLQGYLNEELSKRQVDRKNTVSRVQLSMVEDERCRYYLQALTTLQGAPIIGLGEEVSGFPVVWIGTNGLWYGSVGLNITTALRNGLQQALTKAQNGAKFHPTQALELSTVIVEEKVPQSLEIQASAETADLEVLKSAMQVLERNGKQLLVFDLALEPFLNEGLAGVFVVVLREEGIL